MKKNIIIFFLSLSTLLLTVVISDKNASTEELLKESEVSVLIEDFPKEFPKTRGSKTKEAPSAKEYYEKAFKLFLMTLGLKLTDDQREELAELVDNPEVYLDKSDPVKDVGRGSKVEQVAKEFNFKPSVVFERLLNNNDMAFDHITDLNILKKLQRRVLKDPSLFYARGKYIKRLGPLKLIMGRYTGKLYRIAGPNKGRIDEVDLFMDYSLKEEQVEERFTLTLSHNGKSYSNSRGNGRNSHVKRKGGSIIIDTGPSSFLHFMGRDLELANFYSNGELVGFVKLERR